MQSHHGMSLSGFSQAASSRRRRTSAAALRERILALLADSLPEGWISQPLAPARAGHAGRPRQAAAASAPAADILVISPRGRCHFLFVRAPADRWWDGELHLVPAEQIGEAEAAMARQLRAAGHKARAIWGERDLWRALRSWGCPAVPPRKGGDRAGSGMATGPKTRRATRPVLHLGFGRRRDHE